MSQETVGPFDTQKPLELILARNLLTNISIPGFLSDHRGVLVFYNEAAGALLGIPFEQAGHMDPREWGARFGPFDSAGARIPFEEVPLIIALREGRPVHAPLYIHSVDGEVHHIEVSAIPLTTNEEITGVIGIFWRTEQPWSSARPES
jgi:PAS domain-containing protein